MAAASSMEYASRSVAAGRAAGSVVWLIKFEGRDFKTRIAGQNEMAFWDLNVSENDLMKVLGGINLGEQFAGLNFEDVGETIQHIIRDLDQSAFDLGDATARGCFPSGQLQLAGKFLLGHSALIAQSADLSARYI